MKGESSPSHKNSQNFDKIAIFTQIDKNREKSHPAMENWPQLSQKSKTKKALLRGPNRWTFENLHKTSIFQGE